MKESSIAIIGYSINVPGAKDASSLRHLTQNNLSGLKRSSKEQQKENLEPTIHQNKHFINVGGGPKDYKTFDANFFGVSPKDASLLCPQIRKSLEYAWHSFEHAGYNPSNIKDSVGVYVTSSLNSYFIENLKTQFENASDSEKNHIHFLNEPDFIASRLAYYFNWHGPAYNIKCGCSSSLIAIHEACQALLSYDCDFALSGGAAIKPRYQYGYLYEENGILSKDGRCCPFSDDATGTVFANGIAFVVLKRLEEAIEDGDTIHGVIRATAVNNDGKDKAGYMSPSISGQVAVMNTALSFAELEPQDIDYIEAHGTGTNIGDPIEFEGLKQTYTNCPPNSIALRSVKGNIGHLDAISGVVGLIKTLLDLKHQSISPNHHFNEANPKIDVKNSPFYFSKKTVSWNKKDKGRFAAISSFGIGGTNAQVILEEYQSSLFSSFDQKDYLLALSAKNKSSLLEMKKNLSDYLQLNSNLPLNSISYTLLIGRAHFEYRLAIKAKTISEAIIKLEALTETDILKVDPAESKKLEEQVFYNSEQLKKDYLNGINYVEGDLPPVNCQRLPLPGYYFLKNVHWIDIKAPKNNQKCEDISQWFYLPYWKREENLQPSVNLKNKQILLFTNNDAFSENLKNNLLSHGAKVTMVSDGKQFSTISNNHYRLDFDNKTDYEKLFETLKNKEKLPHWLLHTLSLKNERHFKKAQSKGLYSILFIIQAAINITSEVSFKLGLITSESANVSGNECINPNNATLLGISQVLPKEHEKAITR